MFFLFFIIDFVGSNLISHFVGNMKNGVEYNVDESLTKAEGDLIFIGASQCGGNYATKIFDDSLKMNSYNAGMGGQHIDYQVIIANSIIDRKIPKIIVWDFDPKLFASDNGIYLKLGLNSYYDYNDEISESLNRIDSFMFLKHSIKSYKYNSKLFEILYANIGQVDTRKGYSPFPCNDLGEINVLAKNNYPNFDFDSERKFNLMNENIKKWKDKGIKVIVVVSPMYRKINYKIRGISKAEEICKQNAIDFYDFSQLDGIYNDVSLFRDEIHLCERGSIVYSNYFVEILRSKVLKQ